MPLVAVDEDKRDVLLHAVRLLTEAAEQAMRQLRNALQSAWFARPQDAKGDLSFVEARFREATSDAFYGCVAEIAEALQAGASRMPAATARRWRRAVRDAARETFDASALAGDAEALDLKRVIAARNRLGSWLNGGRQMKDLRALAEEEAA